MADIKQKLGTTNQAITVTVASLTNTSLRQSTVIDNGTTLFMDVIITAKLKSPASGTSATGYVNIYAYGTADTSGPTYTGGASGSDGAYTADTANLILLGTMSMVANATTYTSTFNLSRAFAYGGIPEKWGLVIENGSGGTLDTTGGNHSVHYQGIYGQV